MEEEWQNDFTGFGIDDYIIKNKAIEEARSAETRYRLASNPKSSHQVLTRLATDSYGSIVCAVLKNPACPRAVLDYYAGEGLYLVDILANPACPSDLLVEIYSRWSGVSKLVEGHPNFPEDLTAWSLGLEEW